MTGISMTTLLDIMARKLENRTSFFVRPNPDRPRSPASAACIQLWHGDQPGRQACRAPCPTARLGSDLPEIDQAIDCGASKQPAIRRYRENPAAARGRCDENLVEVRGGIEMQGPIPRTRDQ